MKTLITSCATSSKTKIALLLLVLTVGFSSFNSNGGKKITICHRPPGNVDNCHEISISENALQAHLDHGDKIFCYSKEDLDHVLPLVDFNTVNIMIMY